MSDFARGVAGSAGVALVGLAPLSRLLDGWIADEYRWELSAPYVAVVLVLIAIGVHVSAWSSLSSQRAAGLAAAALTMLVIVGALNLA